MKGGSGKSTTAVHIAVCGQNAGISSAIIDTDPQGSAYRWFTRRTGETPGVIREADPEMLPMIRPTMPQMNTLKASAIAKSLGYA